MEFSHLCATLQVLLSNKTANRGQCVTKYGAGARPAFIGGRERRAGGSRWGVWKKGGYCWRGNCEIGNGKQGGL